MEKITLEFASLPIFWLFTRNLQVKPLKIDIDQRQVTLNYDKAIVDEAVVFYKAVVRESVNA